MEKPGLCEANLTNGTLGPGSGDLGDMYKVITGSLIFVVIMPFTLLNLTVFPIGSTFAVLFGAFLMVIFQVVTQDGAYEVMGNRDNLMVIFILIGILIIAQYFEREQLLVGILRKLLLPSLRFENYLIRVCLVTYLLSIVFTNDVCCMVLTPILLKVWDSQERPRTELETMLLAVMTTANIGGMVTVFSSLQMALITARTSGDSYVHSRLDMRVCFMYLLPVSVIMAVLNVCFLLLHHRVRTRHIENTKLISEPSHSEQEMAGLTARGRNGNGAVNVIDISSHGSVNGYMKANVHDDIAAYDGMYLGPASNQRSDDRISIPCQLETIPEHDILEISSSQSNSLRDCLDMESPSPRHHHYNLGEAIALEITDSSSSNSDEDDRMRNTDENLHQLNINYRPGALQSQNLTTIGDSRSSLACSMPQHGLCVSQRLGVYRSLRAFSVAHFVPCQSVDDVGCVLPSDSIAFLVTLCILLLVVVSLMLASCYTQIFDPGLVPVGAAMLAVITDAVLNRRAALQLIRRADWSIIVALLAVFVWMQGFHNTGLVRHVWVKSGLGALSLEAMELRALGVMAVVVLLGMNVCGSVPMILIVCDLLEPCLAQRGMVLYLAVLTTAGGNITLYGSMASMLATQRGLKVLKYRLSYLTHLQYGFTSTVVLLPLGLLLIYGLLLIGVR